MWPYLFASMLTLLIFMEYFNKMDFIFRLSISFVLKLILNITLLICLKGCFELLQIPIIIYSRNFFSADTNLILFLELF